MLNLILDVIHNPIEPKDYMPLRVRRVGLITVEGTAQ